MRQTPVIELFLLLLALLVVTENLGIYNIIVVGIICLIIHALRRRAVGRPTAGGMQS